MLRGQAKLVHGIAQIHHNTASIPHQRSAARTGLAALATASLRSLLSTMGRRSASGPAATAAASSDDDPVPATPGADSAAAAEVGLAAAAAAGATATPPKPKQRARSSEPSLYVQTNVRQLQPKAAAIGEALQRLYPDPPIPLNHGSNFQLLCAVLLSAQTTDKKVNEVTPELFRLAPEPAAMAALEVATIATCIRQLGLAPTKARNLQAMAAALLERHGGEVPASFAELEALPGVGHKTASVVMVQAHGQDALPVDTHIHRLAQRWGLTSGKSVEQTEADLKLLFPQERWRDLHLQIIMFGREKCPARGHNPQECPICVWAAVHPYDKPGNSPLKPGQRVGSPAKPAAKKRSTAASAATAAPKRGKKAAGK